VNTIKQSVLSSDAGCHYHYCSELSGSVTHISVITGSTVLCYLHYAPENPEDGEMYLLVPAHPGCPRQGPESHKMVVHV